VQASSLSFSSGVICLDWLSFFYFISLLP